MIRTTHVRSSAEHWPPPARPRSGTFRMRRLGERSRNESASGARGPEPLERERRTAERSSCPSFPAPAITEPAPSTSDVGRRTHAERSLIICGALGLLLFPLAGAAVLGRIVSPVVFVAVATFAITLFYLSLAKLEPADT